jgi:hypothetical protein
MVEGATTLKKVCGMDKGSKHKREYEGKRGKFFLQCDLLVVVTLRLLNFLLINYVTLMT